MDPLSVVANLIAVASAASAASKGLERILSLRQVPQEVLQFINEVQLF